MIIVLEELALENKKNLPSLNRANKPHNGFYTITANVVEPQSAEIYFIQANSIRVYQSNKHGFHLIKVQSNRTSIDQIIYNDLRTFRYRTSITNHHQKNNKKIIISFQSM